jgi:hypothetical protein
VVHGTNLLKGIKIMTMLFDRMQVMRSTIHQKRAKMHLPRRGRQPRRRRAVRVTVMKIGPRQGNPIQVVVEVVEQPRRELG